MLIIKITGKAGQVFACLKLMAQKAGTLTIGEIVRLSQLKR